MLYQYHGNDLHILRKAACALLAREPAPPLLAERLVVPNVGMAKWLRMGIAQHGGIAANLRIESPAAFLEGLAQTLFDETTTSQPWSKEQIALRLMRELPPLQQQAGFEAVSRYLQGSDPQRRLYALSLRLAELYDRYLLYRPEWMLGWESGTHEPALADNAWQAVLWRALVGRLQEERPAQAHGARRLQRLIERLRTQNFLDTGLPRRVIGFGLGALAPLFIEAFGALARHSDVHLFLFNPCDTFWYDTESERTLARWRVEEPERAALSGSGNTLLDTWGRSGRSWLEKLLALDGSEAVECFAATTTPGVLGALQRGVLRHEEPRRARLQEDDESLVFAETHSRLREVEALQDQLLHLLGSLDGLRPRDIVVMAPDIGAYASAIDAVFTLPHGDPRRLPYTIADRSPGAANPLLQGFLELLQLPESRFERSALLALLAIPAIGARFSIDAETLQSLRERSDAAMIRWGLSAEPLPDGTPGPERNSWQFGLDRLLLGIAFDEDTVYGDIAALDPGGSDGIEALGRLCDFLERLASWSTRLVAARPMSAWVGLLHELLGDFFHDGPDSAADLAVLHHAIADTATALDDAGHDGPITRSVLHDMLAARLAVPDGAHDFLRGGLNFCQLTPLRSIPFRVVCLLGMNANDFPRASPPPAFDLMARAPRAGDPSPRDDDRYLFLEALLAARDHLYISRVAHDERSDAEREPALPLSELRNHIDSWWYSDDERPASEVLTREHRLKPFDRAYFEPGNPLFSFRHEWLPAASEPGTATAFCAQDLPAPPLDELSLDSLLAFMRNPCRGFLEQRLGVRLGDAGEAADDEEPMALDALARWQLQTALIDTALAGKDIDTIERVLSSSGQLPHGYAGRQTLDAGLDSSHSLLATAADWAALPTHSEEFLLDFDGLRLRGSLSGLRAGRLLRISASKAHGRVLLPFWVQHLCCCAASLTSGSAELHCSDASHALAPLTPALAREHLAELLHIYHQGLSRPLPLFPQSSCAYAQALRKNGEPHEAMARARARFLGDGTGEGSERSVRRVFAEPIQALDEEFAKLAERVFNPLLDALAKVAP